MKLDKITKDKKLQLEKDNYYKYVDIFQTVIDYIRRQKNVLLYGGTAINEYMPPDLKIYGPYVLPDIDVFSLTPNKLADEVVVHLSKKGYTSSTYYGRALHQGTYTVYTSGLKVLDVSYASPEIMRSIRYGGTKGTLGIKCVSPLFIQFTLHRMLAGISVDRWEKVQHRLNAFYKVFPPRTAVIRKPDVTDTMDVNLDIHYYTEGTANTVLLGTPIVNFMLHGGTHAHLDKHLGIPYNIVIVQGSCDAYARAMVNTIRDQCRVSEVYPGNETITQPRHVVVSHKNKPVAIIFEDSIGACLNYNEYKGLRVGTIHTVLAVYLGMLLNPVLHFTKLKPELAAVINELVDVFLHTNSRLKILRPLSLTCQGEEAGIATLRRNKRDDK